MQTRLLPLVFLLALPAGAQRPDSANHRPLATVTGVVRDSVAGTPLVGATVQLVAVDGLAHVGLSALSDTLGRYLVEGVAAGRYMLGFYHPVLDSLGVEAPVREVDVPAAGMVRADLAVPGPARLLGAICGATAATDSSALVVGTVRAARGGAPVAGANVAAEWLELSFTSKGVVRRVPVLAATTNASGWFALCGLPAGGTITLEASHAADSTDRLQVDLPTNGFLRRDLYLGAATTDLPARSNAARDSASKEDSAAGSMVSAPAHPTQPRRRGDGRLRGTVVAAVGSRPLEDAQVGIAAGPVSRTDDHGEWTLEHLPMGTRMLEVRAIGFYPLRQLVQVIDSAPPVRLALSTMKAVLDTIRITARIRDPLATGFDERRHTGMGRYITANDIALRAGAFTSSLFQSLQGLRLERDTSSGDTMLYQRGAFGWCAPMVYLNGQYIAGATIDDIDGWVLPKDLIGIEIYDESTVPPDFQRGMTGCGAVLIWSRRGR